MHGVILAGGAARRMGGADKALVRLGGETLLSRVIARLGPQVAALALSANGPGAAYRNYGLPVLPDPVLADPVPGGLGPLAGILAGLDWAAGAGAARLISVAVDTPFLPRDLALRLEMAAEGAGLPVAMAESGGRTHPTAALWPVSLRGELRAALAAGTRRVAAFAEARGAAVAAFPRGRIDPFFNINTPGDLSRAEDVLGAEDA